MDQRRVRSPQTSFPRQGSDRAGSPQFKYFLDIAHGFAGVGRHWAHQKRCHAGLIERGQAFGDESAWADQRDPTHQFVGHRVDGLPLAAGQVQLLNPVGYLAEPIACRQAVVEVTALGAHTADIEGQLRFDPCQPFIDVISDGQRRVHHNVQRAQCGIPFGGAGRQRRTPDRVGFLRVVEDRLPALGDLGGELDVLRPQRRDRYRNAFAYRVIDERKGFAQTCPAIRGQWDLIVLAVILHPFPAPHLSTDLHNLAGTAYRRVELDAVKALYHLRSGRADPKAESTVGYRVQARLGHRRDVDAGLLEFDDSVDGFVKAARVIQGDPDSHQRYLSRRLWRADGAVGCVG